MGREIIFLSESSDRSTIKKANDVEIFTLDYNSHKNLQQLGIKHSNVETFLNDDERLWIFNTAKKLHDWYKDPSLNIFELKDVNLLGLLDGIELHTLLMDKLIIFWTIKKILDAKNPDIIECPYEIREIINLLKKNNSISIKINSGEKYEELIWDRINVKHNILGKPISMKISRTKYNKLKNILDKTVSSTFGLWFDLKNRNKKTLLILELFPPIYKELLQNLKSDDYNVIIINQRRPVTYDRESIKVLKNSNCKLISKNDLFGEKDEREISETKEKYSQKLLDLWNNNESFDKIFRINGISFWPIIKNNLKQVFTRRMNDYVESVFFAKKLFSKINISCILSLYDVGETEKVFLKCKNDNVDSFLLEHGFSLLSEDSKTFGTLMSYDNFRDKIIVWSNHQKEFLVSNYKIKSDKILALGSPRHDALTRMGSNRSENKKFRVLIAPTPITQLQGHDTTEMHEKFEKLIIRLCEIFKNYHDVELVFKIHPSQSGHNDEIKQIIQEYSKKIPIYMLNPVAELIQSSQLVITITPEAWAPSTIVLESMIVGTPIMNIILDEKSYNYEFEYIQQNAVIAISDDSDLDNEIKQIVYDERVRHELRENGEKFVKSFLKNYGNSSRKLAEFLKNDLK